jgi:hypothetical protein
VVVERKAKVKVDVKTKSVGEIKESILASLKQRLGEQQWPVHIESLVRAESSAIVQRYIWAALGLEVSFGDVYFVSEHRLSKEQKALMAHVNERVRCLVDRWIDDAIDSCCSRPSTTSPAKRGRGGCDEDVSDRAARALPAALANRRASVVARIEGGARMVAPA